MFYASAILNGSDGVWYAQYGKRPETFYIKSIAFRICGTGFKNHTKFRSSCGMHMGCVINVMMIKKISVRHMIIISYV